MPTLAQMVDLADKLTGVVQRDLGKTGHMAAQIGKGHAARQTGKYFEAKLVLDFAQHLAHGWLADAHFLRSRMHVLRARQGVDQHQMAKPQPVAQLVKSDIRHPITPGY